MENISKSLASIGLNKVEIAVYLAVLKHGKSTVTDIARNAELKRPTIYQYVDRIVACDLIRKTVVGKRVMYYPEDPKRVLKMSETAQKRIQDALPQLQNMFAYSSSRPVLRFYEGKESLRNLYREITKTSHTVWSMFAAERYFQVFSQKDGEEFLSNIKSEGGSLRDLVLNTPTGIQYVKEEWGRPVAKSKLLPKEFIFSVDITIAGDKLLLVSFDDLNAVVVENQAMADLQRQFVKFIWKQTK